MTTTMETPIAHRLRTYGAAAVIILLSQLAPLYAGTSGGTISGGEPSSSAFHDYLKGNYATGSWLGMRDTLAARGITPFGGWKGTFYGITGGGIDSPRGAFDEEITLGLCLDFGKLVGIKGLTAQGSVRWRDGRNPNYYVGASGTFQPSRYQSGLEWRLMPFFLTYVTPELFGVKDFLTISGGWQSAYDIFASQPDSKLFTNNSISTAKGIGGVNNGAWSSSYAAWGGYMKIKPSDTYYAMAGLYMAIPQSTATSNHGLDLAGYGPEPQANGLYFLGETGVTPKIGPDKLPGKYAFGAIYFGTENKSYFGATYDQKYNFYWQADQMLFREPSRSVETTSTVASDGKNFKEVKEPTAPVKPSEQGLYSFTFINYAPKYDNAMPFYFQTGFVYKGLIPGRDLDQLGIAFAYGNYSYDKIAAEQDAGKTIHQTYEALVEADYRVQCTKFAYVQPFWQYIIRPGGTGILQNANIFGVNVGVTF